MYLQESTISEQVVIAEHLSFKDQSILNEPILVPDNYAELLIPINQDIDIKIIGNARFIKLTAGSGYFFTPRGRGLEVFSESAKYLLIKINPAYSRSFSKCLPEFSTGIFKLNLDIKSIKELKASTMNNNKYEASDLLQTLFSGENKFDFNHTVLDSIERIKDTYGTTSVKEIYSSLNISKSKLEQHFNREIGLTPKEFCKIEKINRFIAIYKESSNKNLTELTYESGYYDQSHLIKDFNYFLNISPKKYFASIGI